MLKAREETESKNAIIDEMTKPVTLKTPEFTLKKASKV